MLCEHNPATAPCPFRHICWRMYKKWHHFKEHPAQIFSTWGAMASKEPWRYNGGPPKKWERRASFLQERIAQYTSDRTNVHLAARWFYIVPLCLCIFCMYICMSHLQYMDIWHIWYYFMYVMELKNGLLQYNIRCMIMRKRNIIWAVPTNVAICHWRCSFI